MNHRFAVFALAVAFCVSTAALAPALSAASGSPGHASASAKKGKGQKKKTPKKRVFEVCKHGCQFRTIQKAVNAAGKFKHEKKNAKTRAIVEVMPGKSVEGVVLDGTRRKFDFEGLTIIGAKKNPRKTILEGKNAKGELGAAQNGIEVVDVDGVIIKNIWARNYESNGFFVHAATQSGQHCDGYTMNNLIASDNRSYGLFAKGCLGGKMLNSTGFRQGDSAFYIGETPCDTTTWTNHGSAPAPCQAKPKWSVLRNDVSYENVLGYSGTNSKYVLIAESDFFNNGAGIVPNTLDSEGYEPNGWNVFEKNNVFWNNYNYFLAGSAFKTVSGGLGQLAGVTVNYPTGAGIVLYGGAGNIVRQNNIFGNYKWGVASFSGPGESFVANVGDDAKNINNQIVENSMGRGGTDPNGEFDFWNDATGGGNCWSGNSAGASFAPGNGSIPPSTIYPACPQPSVLADQVRSLNLGAGLQVILGDEGNPSTILGYAGQSPAQNQQCSWVRRVSVHPPFESFIPVEVVAQAGELTCK
jgi:parallel beta-helix repeat protein